MSNYINRILLAKGPNGSNLDQLFEVKNQTGNGKHNVILNSDYDLSANITGGYFLQLGLVSLNNGTDYVVIPKNGNLIKIYAKASGTGIDAGCTLAITKNAADLTTSPNFTIAQTATLGVWNGSESVESGDMVSITASCTDTSECRITLVIDYP
jgi:hypothetical protein